MSGKNCSVFKTAANYVINGGTKAIKEGKAKAKGATRTPIGKRK